MDEYTDAWFIGFDPNITVGVWVGYDEKKPLGNGETGAQAALPIWMDFMRAYIDTHGDREDAAHVRGARQHRLRDISTRDHRSVHQRHATRRSDSRRAAGTAASRGSAARRRVNDVTKPTHEDCEALRARVIIGSSCCQM